jgi:PPOX class probable F420-dependent enzyme
MHRRNQITMTNEEVNAFLAEGRILQVATLDHDGYPHLVAMWYVLLEGQIAFWTYRKSQKALNLRRDPRLTCLVESGKRYDELRGVQVKGHADIHENLETVRRFGLLLMEHYNGPLQEQERQMVELQAPKRIVVIVKPVETVSWDHRKLAGVY